LSYADLIKRNQTLKLVTVGIVAIVITASMFYGRSIYEYFAAPILIGDGDSLMGGGGDELELVANRLREHTNQPWYPVNIAIGGQKVSQIAEARLVGVPRFKLPWAKRIVWLIGGTNDLAAGPGGADAVEKLLADVEKYFRNLQTHGYSAETCFYTDILPRSGSPNPTFEEDRILFNSKIADRLAGLAHVIPSGENPMLQNSLDLHYYYDGTHLTGYGSAELANDAFKVISGSTR